MATSDGRETLQRNAERGLARTKLAMLLVCVSAGCGSAERVELTIVNPTSRTVSGDVWVNAEPQLEASFERLAPKGMVKARVELRDGDEVHLKAWPSDAEPGRIDLGLPPGELKPTSPSSVTSKHYEAASSVSQRLTDGKVRDYHWTELDVSEPQAQAAPGK